MTDPLARIPPVPREPGDHAAHAVHGHLRRLILDGALPPGAVLNQIDLAPRLGVSRTPVREAIRMLQEEGLVEAEPQKRARVAAFDPAHLETVYTQRILLESLGAQLTAPTMSDEDLAALESLRKAMTEDAERGDLEAWDDAHKRFHFALVAGAGPHLLQVIGSLMDRAEHYRTMYQESGPRAWANAGVEHKAIVEAFERRDAQAAGAELAAHLARTALSLVAQLSPHYDPRTVRNALACMSRGPLADVNGRDAVAGVRGRAGRASAARS